MDLLLVPVLIALLILAAAGLVTQDRRSRMVILIIGGVASLATQNWLLGIPVLIVGGIAALTARRTRAEMRSNAGTGRFAGFRKGLAAVPFYFLAVGAGHVVLALVWSERTVGLARDGQAFSGTFVLGLAFILCGLVAAPFTIPVEGERGGFVRGALIGLGAAAVVLAYTASQGYLVGGTPGDIHCIVEQGRELCPPGDGTWIMDARPDVLIMLLATLGAYALSHLLARVASPAVTVPA